ncbi:hypothetical protein Tco_0439837, partial [Tanacetum coccineum]
YDHGNFRAFPSYEAKHRLEIHFHVEKKHGLLRGVRSVLVLPSKWFPLTRVKWLPLIANSFAVSGIVIAEPGVRATTRSKAQWVHHPLDHNFEEYQESDGSN